jgi:hypothetical protein
MASLLLAKIVDTRILLELSHIGGNDLYGKKEGK